MKQTQFFNHVMTNVPNRWYWHLLISYLSRRMRNSNSRWYIERKYRGPKKGGYSPGGNVTKGNAKSFAVYLRVREGAFEKDRLEYEKHSDTCELQCGKCYHCGDMRVVISPYPHEVS